MRQQNLGELVRLVLVQPMYHGNFGAVVRLCVNYGVRELVVVSNQGKFIDEALSSTEFRNAATSHGLEWFADRLQKNAVRGVPDVMSAVADCSAAIGFSRRVEGPHRVASLSQDLLGRFVAEKATGVTALVFGREDGGLSNDELRYCSHLCSFNVAPEMPSLNLSHAVAVALSSVFMGGAEASECRSDELTTIAEVENLVALWDSLLKSKKISGDQERSVAHFRRVLQKAGVTALEFGSLRAVLTKLGRD